MKNSKAYHQLMRGCGLSGPHRMPDAPNMEYWGACHSARVDNFTDMREKNLMPFLSMVYRDSGDLCIGVFLDKPNADCVAPERTDLELAAPDLLAALEAMLAADEAICANAGRKSDQTMNRIAAIDAARAAVALARGTVEV